MERRPTFAVSFNLDSRRFTLDKCLEITCLIVRCLVVPPIPAVPSLLIAKQLLNGE